ncbi:MAG: cyanophycin synthetase [Patescibacteria group bacterium]
MKNTIRKHRKQNLVSRILKRVAPRIGALVILDPEFGFAGQITYKSGVRRYFRVSSLDLNRLGASEIARDKDYATFFINKMGYPVITGRTFFSDEWAETVGSNRDIHAAYQYARKLGFPVFVKPNSKSGGVAVAKVHSKRDFYQALRRAFKEDRVALVQKVVEGRDYRLVVLDDKIISAYERIPLAVVGDGKSTIRQLLESKQEHFRKINRDTLIRIDDYRIAMNLRRRGLDFDSVMPIGEKAQLLDNANLSTGGDSADVTDIVHQSFKEIAVKLARDMGLRLCGVDLIIRGDINEPVGEYWVIEINSAPGLDNYSAIGARQASAVENLYLQVLKAME